MRIIILAMTTDDNEFELKLGRLGRGETSGLRRVRTAVRMRTRGRRTRLRTGGGRMMRQASRLMRVVVVKARFAAHGIERVSQLRAEVKYLARAGSARDRGEAGPDARGGERHLQSSDGDELSFYNARETGLDAQAMTAGWAVDARHLRLIIAADDGEALGDLRPMVREIMARLEVKLATRLDWLAVDHWDTSGPHTHVLVRGRTAKGRDLVVPWGVITHELREHAEEIVTRVLGPPDPVDLKREEAREVNRRGLTALDRQLVADADQAGLIMVRRPDLIARLDALEVWGLASRERQGWRIRDDLFASLRAMERHAEIEKAVSFHQSRGRHLPVLAAEPQVLLAGVLVHLGPADEFGDGLLAVIETGQGELRYQRFEREVEMARLRGTRPGAIIAFEPSAPKIRTSDYAIAAIAERSGGLYSAALHFEVTPEMSGAVVAANVRRLEAMRRLSLIARTEDGEYIVGHDHLRRARLYEERLARAYPLSPAVLSDWSLEQQIEAVGPTHLDRVTAGEAAPLDGMGDLARRFARALQQRRAFLIDQGWMRNDEPALSRQARARMAERELRGLADRLAIDLGKSVITAGASLVNGVYVQRFDLAQGRVALVVDERQASLLPWRPMLERFRGRMIEGVLREPRAPAERVMGMGLTMR